LICVSLKVKSLKEHTGLHGNPTSELADVTCCKCLHTCHESGGMEGAWHRASCVDRDQRITANTKPRHYWETQYRQTGLC